MCHQLKSEAKLIASLWHSTFLVKRHLVKRHLVSHNGFSMSLKSEYRSFICRIIYFYAISGIRTLANITIITILITNKSIRCPN